MTADAIQGIREYFQGCGADHFLAGYSRDSHDLPLGAAAIVDFHIGYDAAAAAERFDAARVAV